MPKNTIDRSAVRLTPTHRYWMCPLCNTRVSVRRQGRNARAATSILTGMVNKHLADWHPEPPPAAAGSSEEEQ